MRLPVVVCSVQTTALRSFLLERVTQRGAACNSVPAGSLLSETEAWAICRDRHSRMSPTDLCVGCTRQPPAGAVAVCWVVCRVLCGLVSVGVCAVLAYESRWTDVALVCRLCDSQRRLCDAQYTSTSQAGLAQRQAFTPNNTRHNCHWFTSSYTCSLPLLPGGEAWRPPQDGNTVVYRMQVLAVSHKHT